MKKVTFFVLGIFLACSTSAQTEQLNAKKYWKFRNAFRQNFIKIGTLTGEGIPAAARQPIGCTNNVNSSGNKGNIRWADAGIFQGHYIGFLATEYKLLKDAGQDLKTVTNELYYALNAVNRIDRDAEQIITEIPENNFPIVKDENLNGFYIRDDVPEDFWKNWQDEEIDCQCNEGDSYKTDNLARLNSGGYTSRYRTHDLSGPSLDQMTSLLVGLKLCTVLLDDDLYVKPTEEDSVLNLKGEAKAIMNRLINFAYSHNWFLLNMWGWPVANGGGELMFTSYPIRKIGEEILGHTYNDEFRRRKFTYDSAQVFYELPFAFDRDTLWESMTFSTRTEVNLFDSLNHFPTNADSAGNFQIFQYAEEGVDLSVDMFDEFWESKIPENWPFIVDDWETDYKFDLTLGFPFGLIPFKSLNITDYNTTILFNLGVASQLFQSDEVDTWAHSSENYQLLLVDAIFRGTEPTLTDRAFFEELLNSMPVYGGFKFAGQEYYSADSVGPNQIIWSEGWGGEYKWNDPEESNSSTGHEGQFNGLDYLYLHNLYHIVYGDELDFELEETYDCFCGDVSMTDIYALQSVTNDDIGPDVMSLEDALTAEIPLHSNTVKQLEVLDFCASNVFSGSATTDTVDIIQLFDHYHEIGISLNEFQTEDFTVSEGGQVNIESRLIICNEKTLTTADGGSVNLDKGEIRINPGASIIIHGDLNIARFSTVVIEDGGKLIIKDGGTLANSGIIRLKEGATLEYEEGATFKMQDDFAELHFDGGDLIIRENADFIVVKGATQSGLMRFSTWGSQIEAEANTTFFMEGTGTSDSIMIIEKDADFWCASNELESIHLFNGYISLDSNARLVSLQKLTLNDIHVDGIAENRGLVLFHDTHISGSTFDESRIYAPLFFKNAGIFDMTTSTINGTTTSPMVKIKGMGYNITNTDFNGSANYMLSAQNGTVSSKVYNCHFTGDLSTVGVLDQSSSDVQIEKNTFNTLYAAVHKVDGRANVKCNQFLAFQYAGIVADAHCLLDLSSLGSGGYNIFEKNDAAFGQNIALWNAQSILLDEGYNRFDDEGSLPILTGTVNVWTPPATSGFLHARVNQWNAPNTIPPAARFDVISSITENVVGFVKTDPEDADCPSSSGGLVSGVAPFTENGGISSYVVNTASFSETLLSDAIDFCIEATEPYSGASDLIALALFEEVLLEFPDMDSSEATRSLINLAVNSMKHTVQRLFANDVIQRSENTATFHEGVQRYVNVLNVLTDQVVTVDNYDQLFYWEMDKAHLFHLLGNRNLAIMTLVNLESCGLDSLEQVHVNRWKYQLDEEINQISYGDSAAFIDSNWVDTSFYPTPIHQGFGQFGSAIQSPTMVEFYNCSNPRISHPTNASVMTGNTPLSVYPNPSQGIYQVSYALPPESTGNIVVHSADGKEVCRIKCTSGKHTQTIDITGMSRGTYVYSFLVDGALNKSGKLILK